MLQLNAFCSDLLIVPTIIKLYFSKFSTRDQPKKYPNVFGGGGVKIFWEGLRLFREGLRFFWEGLTFSREGLKDFGGVEMFPGKVEIFSGGGGGEIKIFWEGMRFFGRG